MTYVGECFSSNYAEARAKFLDAAQRRGASMQAFHLPLQKGPMGEELALDVASFGNVESDRLLMIVSGTHGVEGYAGSACQVRFLRSPLSEEIAGSVRVVLVHAVNPHGFAYMRRTNEDNIDLNRNFVDFSRGTPSNPKYAEYASAFLPSGCTLEDYQAAAARLDEEAVARDGYQFLKKALQPGQYEFPGGLYYGGREPAWSNKTFRAICRKASDGLRIAAVVDIHTGLGACGVGELLFMTQETARKYETCFAPPVSCAGAQSSVSSRVEGPLCNAAIEELMAPTTIACALEFGTVPVQENLQAKIFENWTHQHFPLNHPLRDASRERLRAAYFCDNAEWKRKVIARSDEVIRSLFQCLKTPVQ